MERRGGRLQGKEGKGEGKVRSDKEGRDAEKG